MSRPNAPRADIAQDVLRIHGIVTRALDVSVEHIRTYTRQGYPDATSREALIAYVRCLAVLLHAHHVTEDKSVFPYLRDKLPDAPYDALTKQHRHMDPLLEAINGALESVASAPEAGEALEDLDRALVDMQALWLTHIGIEESHITSERIRAVIDDAEQARMSRVFARQGQAHQMGIVPLYWLLPFLLYNLTGEDRDWMSQQVPRIVTRVLLPVVWKKKWQPMMPFLLE